MLLHVFAISYTLLETLSPTLCSNAVSGADHWGP